MKTFLKILILNLFFIQIASAQSCDYDSVVVHVYKENRDNFQGLLVQTIIETSVFNRDSGIVRIYSQSSAMGDPFTQVNVLETVWVQTDTIRNTSGEIVQIYSKIGSVTGWQNYKTENYQYNASNLILSKTQLSWSGSNWDSVSYNTWNYDAQNNLIESADYLFSAGVRNNMGRHEIVYVNNLPYSKTFSIGIAGNQWEFKRRFIFTYTGNLRTNVEVDNYISSAWQTYGFYTYGDNFGEYSFILPEYTPIVLNGISSADTILTAYDTLEERTYYRRVHFTAIDTTDVFFGVEGSVNYYYYNRYNGQLQRTFEWYSNWAVFDLTDSSWYSMDRPYVAHYYYDQLGRCDTILSSGSCTNPCGREQYFLYDSLGRMYYNSDYSWTMVTDHFRSNTYYFSDTASISILIAPNDVNVSGCSGDTFQPTISVIGGCKPYTYHWYPSTGLSSDTILQPDMLIGQTTTYTLVVNDNAGHTDSSTITIGPAYYPNLELDSLYCNGNADLRLPWGSGTFSWYLDSVPIPGANRYYYTATSQGDYHVNGNVNVGSIYSYVFSCTIQSDTVNVPPVPMPLISFSNDTIYTDLSGIQYDWYHDNVMISSSVDSFLVTNQDGIYQVIVTL